MVFTELDCSTDSFPPVSVCCVEFSDAVDSFVAEEVAFDSAETLSLVVSLLFVCELDELLTVGVVEFRSGRS